MTAWLDRTGWVFDPIVPPPLLALIGLLLAGFTIAVYGRVGSAVGAFRNAVLLLFRLLGIVALLVILLQPARLEHIPPPVVKKTLLVGLDTSRSMRQADLDQKSRLEHAKELLRESRLVTGDGLAQPGGVRFFEFNDDAVPVLSSVWSCAPRGDSTRLHRSIITMLNGLPPGEGAKALVLLTDGHDFEMASPARTGFIARTRQVPLYAVPMGNEGRVRDISARITSYQPYAYVKQKARIDGVLRLVGCEYETIEVRLLRQGQVVRTQRLAAAEEQQLPVQFEVTEPETGQYEYEIQAEPLEGEVDTQNNSALTYLNVIDQQIRVLILEGSPYWDTTFLQRSLFRNDKVQLDSIIQYAPQKVRLIRQKEEGDPLKVPETAADFASYDLIVLGRDVDRLLSRRQLDLLEAYVRNSGGSVVFSRGPAFSGELADNNLEPVVWGDVSQAKVRLQVAREGRSLAPFRILADPGSGFEKMPELLGGRSVTEEKPLSATLAEVRGGEGNQVAPGMVHRRFGQGQVLSIGVDGLWRWAFNARVEGMNTLFDRFWDQMVLWLMAGRDVLPNKQFSLRASSANVQLGEKIYFRLVMRNPDPQVQRVPMTFYQGTTEMGRAQLQAQPGQAPGRLTADYLPEKTGKYRVVIQLPDGSAQENRFMVFQENLEETEVATDLAYLKRLCESSGGRVLQPAELTRFVSELRNEKTDTTPKTRRVSLWDRTWFFYLAGLLFGVDWWLRRRWGLC